MKKSKQARKTSVWFQRHAHDPHVRQAQREGKRSRAAFKLTEIMEQHGLQVRKGQVVVDLGCAPGSWSVELARAVGAEGLVIGVDLLPMKAVEWVHVIQGDFNHEEGQKLMVNALAGRKVDLVVSDMAPEISGNKLVDQMRMIGLNEVSLYFAQQHLRKGGSLLLKSFMGEGYDEFRRTLGQSFQRVRHIKPAASRSSSPEFFLLAEGLT
ncbi:MAG: RlmE family RNA methyltransferase [Mariprofundaceae bacterium]|nr:RlmE family RNA methyltransferase [Mariprofundaceae bacterium]